MPLTIAIDDELLKRLKRLAEERGISVSGVVNEMIRSGLGSPAVGHTDSRRPADAEHDRTDAKRGTSK